MITHDLRVIADAIIDKKGQNVVSLDLRPVGSSIADHFMICNGDSTTNVAAIADNIMKKAKEELGMKPLRTQGLENDFWIILDYGYIVVHVFLTQYREFYRLEELWADAPRQEYVDEPAPVKKTSSTTRVKPKAATKVRASVRKVRKTTEEE